MLNNKINQVKENYNKLLFLKKMYLYRKMHITGACKLHILHTHTHTRARARARAHTLHKML